MTIAEREMLERSEIGILAFSWMGKFLAGKIDHLGEKMDKGFAELKEEIRATREELSEKMDKGFGELKEEVRATREEVRLTREELKDEIRATREELGEKLDTSIRRTEEFHTETAKRFDYLDAKYGEFSATLGQLVDKMGAMEQDIKEIKDGFLKLVEHITKRI
jgi:DNA repair exonuclease SbcCD ATPase subunit